MIPFFDLIEWGDIVAIWKRNQGRPGDDPPPLIGRRVQHNDAAAVTGT